MRVCVLSEENSDFFQKVACLVSDAHLLARRLRVQPQPEAPPAWSNRVVIVNRILVVPAAHHRFDHVAVCASNRSVAAAGGVTVGLRIAPVSRREPRPGRRSKPDAGA